MNLFWNLAGLIKITNFLHIRKDVTRSFKMRSWTQIHRFRSNPYAQTQYVNMHKRTSGDTHQILPSESKDIHVNKMHWVVSFRGEGCHLYFHWFCTRMSEMEKVIKIAEINFWPKIICTKKWPKNDTNWPKIAQKLPKIVQIGPKMTPNCQNGPKITRNGPKISTSWKK